MYRLEDLKDHIQITTATVECPVAGCTNHVPRQRGRFCAKPEFLCAEHGIYISPSTFEYQDVRRNFPLADETDWALLHETIASDKRETHRLARERSEDAVTYNAFRSIERAGRLPQLIELFTERSQTTAELIYWSCSLKDAGPLPLLQEARMAFFERLDRGSEPDLIAITPTDLLFIEVKLCSGNETTPSRPEVLRQYHCAEGGWYDRVFACDPEHVAIASRKYELMRFWLLGSWMARKSAKRFTLVSLTREIQDMDLQQRVSPLFVEDEARSFGHWAWEAVADFAHGDASTETVSEYLWSKSVGYDTSGVLQPMLSRIVY